MKKLVNSICVLFSCALPLKGQIMAGDSLSANVYYQNLNNLLITCATYCGPSHSTTGSNDIDINNDSVDDLKFEQNSSSSPGGCYYDERIWTLNNNIQFAVISSDTTFIDTIPGGTLIDNNRIWHYHNFHFLHDYSNFMGNPYNGGVFDSLKRFLGFRLIEPTDTLYGWFLLRLQYSAGLISGIIITSFGINKPVNGIPEQEVNIQINAYPNPANSYLVFESDMVLMHIELVNFFGNSVLSTMDKKMEIRNISSGIYFARIQTEKGYVIKKIVIQH